MPKIDRTATPITSPYTKLASETKLAQSENNDCVVKAFALAAKITYNAAHKICAANGRKTGEGMYVGVWKPMMEREGNLKLVEVNERDFIDQYPTAHRILKNVTTHHPDRFNAVWADGNDYLIRTKGHVSFVGNGKLHDWARGRSLRAVAVYRIERQA